VRGAVVLAAAGLGALLAAGSGLAILFELDGFGRQRDAEPRALYLAALAAALVACVTGPVYLWRRLLPQSAPSWALAALPLALAVLAVLGLSR